MADTTQLEFSRAVEGTFIKGIGPHLSPALKAKLRAEGLDLDRPLLPAYPAKDFHRWLDMAVTDAFPGEPRHDALRKAGRRVIESLLDSMIGRALAAGLKVFGPKNTMRRLERVFRNNNNYMELTVTDTGERAARVQINQVWGLPHFYQGVFEAGMELTGAKNIRVQIQPSPPPGMLMHVEWDN